MRILYAIIFLTLFYFDLSAQNYTRDAGVRFGQGVVGSYRQFYKEEMAVELFGGFLNQGIVFGGMKEHFSDALAHYSGNIRVYYGYGVHTGFNYTNKYRVLNRQYRYDWKFSPLFGLDGIAGIEYIFPEVPLLVSFDINPSFEFSLNRIFELNVFDITFLIKYRF
ncbi:MAG: hypothetical protein JXB34_04055 [Bacteroidales bacterium]|nr:hypothetical protein [Bacteroidales bacterium]